MRNVLVALALAVCLGRLAFAGEDAVEKKPKPGGKPVVAAGAKADGDQEVEKKIKGLLKTKKVTFDFVETPIGDAMNFIQGLLGVNMVLDPGLDKGVPLTLRVNDMAVGQAVQWMAKMVGAKMDVRDGAVVIERAKEGEREFIGKPKHEKVLLKLDPDRLARRGFGLGPLGKAVIPLGDGTSVELSLTEDDLPPETRRALLLLLHKQLIKELGKHDPKAAVEFQEQAARRERMEAEERARRAAEEARERERLREKIRQKVHKLPKPEPRGDENKGQF